MTITSTQNRVSYAGNGAPGVPGTLVFAVPFRFLATSDLVVLVRVDATGVSTTMGLDTAYSVAGEGAATGGTVTFLIEDGEPQTGETLIIYGNPAMTQLVDYISGGTFPAESHEEALDRLTLQSTRTREIAERALPLTDVSTDGSGQYNANSNRISSLGTPTATTDATTKTYVDVAINSAGLTPPTGLIATGSVTSRLLADRFADVVNVKDFGAAGDAVADDTAAFQAALDHIEGVAPGRGGTVYVPRGNYLLTDKIRVGQFTTLRGESGFASSLIWNASYTSGNCIELGPNVAGAGSTDYVFGARLEDLYLNAGDVDRGEFAAVVYTVGAHQFAGLKNVWMNRVRNIGIYYDQGLGAPACFQLYGVEIQGSASAPAAGSTIGMLCNGGGAVIDAQMLVIQGSSANTMSCGIKMLKDQLSLDGGHFEHSLVGICLAQNSTSVKFNTITSVTGHTTTPTLVQVAAASNCEYTLVSVSNETISATPLTVLQDLVSLVTLSATGGESVGLYSNRMAGSFAPASLAPSFRHASRDSGGANRGGISVGNAGNTRQLNFGIDDADSSAWVQGWVPGGGASPIMLNPVAANVGIGLATTPSYLLHLGRDDAAKTATTLWTVTSDARVKSNIVPADLSRCYEIVKSIPLVHHGWADGFLDDDTVADKSQLGWIAQDVEAAFPKAISTHEIKLDASESREAVSIPDGKHLNSDQLLKALYGAVQFLISEVEGLKKS